MVVAVNRQAGQAGQRVLELAVGVVAVAHSFFLIVHVHGVFALGPYEVVGEEFFHAGGPVQAVKLRCLGDVAEVPAGAEGQGHLACVGALAASLNLRSAGLGRGSRSTDIRIQPYANRGVGAAGVRNHGRIQLAVLLEEHLVGNAGLLGRCFFADGELGVDVGKLFSLGHGVAPDLRPQHLIERHVPQILQLLLIVGHAVSHGAEHSGLDMTASQCQEGLIDLVQELLDDLLDLALQTLIHVLDELGVLQHVLGSVRDDFSLRAGVGQLLASSQRRIDFLPDEGSVIEVLGFQGCLDGLLVLTVVFGARSLQHVGQLVASNATDRCAKGAALHELLTAALGGCTAVDVQVDGVGIGVVGAVLRGVFAISTSLGREEHHVDLCGLGQMPAELDHCLLGCGHVLHCFIEPASVAEALDVRIAGHVAEPADGGLVNLAGLLGTGHTVSLVLDGLSLAMLVSDGRDAARDGAGRSVDAAVSSQVAVLELLNEGVHIAALMQVGVDHRVDFVRAHLMTGAFLGIIDDGQDALVTAVGDLIGVNLDFGVRVLHNHEELSVLTLDTFKGAFDFLAVGALCHHLVGRHLGLALHEVLGLVMGLADSSRGAGLVFQGLVQPGGLYECVTLGRNDLLVYLRLPAVADAVLFGGECVTGNILAVLQLSFRASDGTGHNFLADGRGGVQLLEDLAGSVRPFRLDTFCEVRFLAKVGVGDEFC